MSESPITDRMLEANGLRCACAERPIAKCYELEALCGRLAGALAPFAKFACNPVGSCDGEKCFNCIASAALAEFDRASRSSQ